MITQQGTRTPVVLDGLLELLTAATADEQPLAGVQVIDGAAGTVDLANDVVMVAPSEGPADEAVVVNRVRASGLGPQAYVEQTHVTMAISAYTGDTNMAVRRARASAIFNAVKALVDAAKVRDGEWDNLYLGDQEAWYQVQTEQGAVVGIGFTIVAEAIV